MTAALAFLSACPFEPGSGRCEETTIEVDSVVVGASQQPITLRARLIREDDGRPVAGARLVFFARSVAPSPSEPTRSFNVGDATTGADGRAEYVAVAGVTGLVLFPTDRLTGYSVEFRPTADVGGVQYCFADAEAGITVEG